MMKQWATFRFPLFASLLVLFILFSGLAAPCYAQEIAPDSLQALKYRHIGPPGNRIVAVVGVPGDPEVCYAGAASGGVWKSTDGGINWKPVFDRQPVQSIGSLAIAPSDSNIVWAGTGETFIRSNISIGDGIYKSTDAGETWKNMGLGESGRIGRIVVDPRDADVVFAAALGHSYGPQEERGVFRTTDGGESWEKVLYVDENTGASDIAMDPTNPRILFAGMWQLDIKTWGRWSGGPGSGLYMSRDGGTTWKRLEGHGLPNMEMGKIAVAISQSHPNRIYALIETKDGALWRSEDGGTNWRLISRNHLINERPHYYTRLAVAPDDPNEVYFPCVRFSLSLDGGKTIEMKMWGGDVHDVWIDPLNPERIMLADDGGVTISLNRGDSWHRVILPVAQMYHVDVDNRIPYYVYGNRQDGPSYRGPSNSRVAFAFFGGGIPSGLWHTVAGCECGFAIPDPVDNDIVWGGCYNAGLDRFDLSTRHNRSVRVWPESPMGWPAGDLKYRFQWTFPIAISPHDHNKVYVGSQQVHQTTDGGNSWKVISPDLSLNNQEQLQDSGGITIDNLGVEYGCVIFALAESPLEEGLIWAGTNDGQVQVTRDGGANWTNVTGNIPGLPPQGTVSNIEPSRYDAGTTYVTVDLHQVNNRDPFVYKTTDYGQSWKRISSDIPKSVFSYAHCVREDPKRKGLLYLGTENALYFSMNDGENWIPLQSNLPHAPVHWLVVQDHFNDLVVATYGRGFWILDDITPLQQMTPETLDADVHLFGPRPAYRFIGVNSYESVPGDQCVGQNPPYGASINYHLKSVPEGPVQLAILDETGQTVRTLRATKQPGINRVWWDLRHEPPKQANLRTKPPGHDHVDFGWGDFAGFAQLLGLPMGRREERTRPIISWGTWGGMFGPMAVPGTYTVKLKVGEKELTEELVVKKDPNSSGSEADIRSQVKMSLEIRDSINSTVELIDRAEWLRRQLYDLKAVLGGDEARASILSAADELDKKVLSIEEHLFQIRLGGGTEDAFRAPIKLYGQLSILAGDVGGGSADFPPTTQQVEVHETLKKRLADCESRYEEVLSRDLAAFNQLLAEQNVPNITDRSR